VAFKIRQNAFPAGALPRTPQGVHDALPNSLVDWEGDTILSPSALATKTRRLRRLSLAGNIPKYFPQEQLTRDGNTSLC